MHFQAKLNNKYNTKISLNSIPSQDTELIAYISGMLTFLQPQAARAA